MVLRRLLKIVVAMSFMLILITSFRHFGGAKRWMQMSMSAGVKTQRIERIISNRGVGSRKEVQKMLKQGRVKVNGKLERSSSARYPPDVAIAVDNEKILPVPILALYHKPVGVVSSMNDYESWDRETLQGLQAQFSYLKSMHPVGRLDKDTSGLLLFSSNGQLTNYLLSPKSEIEREYEAIVANDVDKDELSSVLEKGVKTSIGVFKAKLLECKVLDQKLPISVIRQIESDSGVEIDSENEKRVNKKMGEVSNDATEATESEETVPCSYVRLSVREGKHRMVRRMLHNAGPVGRRHSVINLHRVRYGQIVLGDDLEEGEVKPCSLADSTWVFQLGTFVQ